MDSENYFGVATETPRHWAPLQNIKAVAPFLVFADSPGYRPPNFRHPTRYTAEVEARRLSALNPGVAYFVLGSLSVTSVPKANPTTRSLVA